MIYEGFEVQRNERFDALDGASAAALNLTYGDKLDSENQLVSFLSILEVAKQSFSEHLRRSRGPRMDFCEPVPGNDSSLPGSVKVFTNPVCEKSFKGRNMMEACNRNKLDLLKKNEPVSEGTSNCSRVKEGMQGSTNGRTFIGHGLNKVPGWNSQLEVYVEKNTGGSVSKVKLMLSCTFQPCH